MKVVFVDTSVFNLGVAILSAVLKNAGVQVTLVHCPFPKDYRHNYFERPELCFDFDAVHQDIRRLKPDVVCFSLMSHNFLFYKKLAKMIKESSPTPIVVGGVLPTIDIDLVMDSPCDAAVIGEGENVILDVLKGAVAGCFSDIPNICYRDAAGHVVHTRRAYAPVDLDLLPHSDFDLYPKTKMLYVSTSRGCVMSCAYCSSGKITMEINGSDKKRVRKRRVSRVIAEIENALAKTPPNTYDKVFFFDDFFVTTGTWLSEFASEYRRRIGLPFYCMAFPATLTEENCRHLADAGCRAVYMGFQTAKEDYKKSVLNRRETVRDVAKAIGNARTHGIACRMDQIIGLPDHGDEHVAASLRFFVNNRIRHIGVFFLSYFPGASLVDYAHHADILSDAQYDAVLKNTLIGDWRFRGTIVDRESSDRNVQTALLFQLLGVLPGVVVLWMHKIKLYRCFPTSWQCYSLFVILNILQYEGITGAKLLMSYIVGKIKTLAV